MDNLIMSSATVGIVISLLAYEIGLAAQRKWKLALLNPLLISIAIVIAFLVVFHVDYESYNMSAKYLSYLLTPATVSLAIPLYLQLAARPFKGQNQGLYEPDQTADSLPHIKKATSATPGRSQILSAL